MLSKKLVLYLMKAYFPEVLNTKNINNVMKLIYKNWSDDLYFGYIKSSLCHLIKSLKTFQEE